jgi:hypothetical protein
MTQPQSKAIVRVKTEISPYVQDPTWQRAWLEIEPIAWRSIAVIPVSEGSSLAAVHGLAEVAWQQRGHSVVVADIGSITLPMLSAIRDELRYRVARGERILIAARSVFESPATATIAREADGVVLCVELGKTKRKSVADTIKQIGKNRIIGTISLRPSGRQAGIKAK